MDASIVLYAVLKTKKPLPNNLQAMKQNATNIFKRINSGEPVVSSVVHFSEISNILEARCPLEEVTQIIVDLLLKESIVIYDVSKNDYLNAAILAQRYKVGINDALAKLLMDRHNISEIYSFDKHFDNFTLKRITL
jgi:predicted nucleic acid-binding protein